MNGLGSEIKRIILPCLRRIVQIAHHLCLTFEGRCSSEISQMWVEEWPRWFNLYHNIVSVQVDIKWLLWRLYDNRCILLWWMCSTVRDYTLLIKYLFATWCGSVPLDCSYVLLWIDTIVFYFVLIALKTIKQFIGNNYQLDEWSMDKRFPRWKMV